MKLLPGSPHSQHASTLLSTLVLSGVLAVGTISYLSLMEQQSRLSVRSQSWNTALAIVEAGIEEGLEHLNNNHTNLLRDGWTLNGPYFTRTQTLADGNSYTVTIDTTTDPAQPTIYSRTDVTPMSLAQNRPGDFFATANLPGVTAAPTLSRAVRVRCSQGALFSAALVAQNSIDLSGNGVYTDSYDSSIPAKSTNGRYDPTKYSGDQGDIATNGGITDSVGIQNASIYGRVHTGPNCPVSIGSQGAIGTHDWQATHRGAQPSYVLQDANFTYPDTTLPATTGVLPAVGGDVVTASYNFGTNAITSATYPNPAPLSGVATNVAYCTTLTYPSPAPTWATTNRDTVTTTTLPMPKPASVLTNYSTINVTTATYPAAGSYLGGVTTNRSKNKNNPPTYTYNQITGITYTYSTFSYTYPSFTYTYNLNSTTVTYVTNHYDYIISGNTTNVANSLTGTTLVRGPNACLILPNGLTGSENILLDNGASLLIYAGGNSVSISGNQVLNPSGFAGNFIVFCAPSITSFTLNGNGQFTGVLVAPNADLVLNGGGTGDQDFCGAILVKNARLNGHFRFHYDEALCKGPANGRFLVSSWDEIDPKTIPGTN